MFLISFIFGGYYLWLETPVATHSHKIPLRQNAVGTRPPMLQLLPATLADWHQSERGQFVGTADTNQTFFFSKLSAVAGMGAAAGTNVWTPQHTERRSHGARHYGKESLCGARAALQTLPCNSAWRRFYDVHFLPLTASLRTSVTSRLGCTFQPQWSRDMDHPPRPWSHTERLISELYGFPAINCVLTDKLKSNV